MLVTWHEQSDARDLTWINCLYFIGDCNRCINIKEKKIESGRRKSGVIVLGDDKKLIRDCLAVSKKARSTF